MQIPAGLGCTSSVLLLITFVTPTLAHSWIEQMQTIDNNGSFTGAMGYPRSYIARTDPGYKGDPMTWLLPALSSGRTRIDNTDLLCHTNQRKPGNTPQYPVLTTKPGSFVAMKYLENGHVSLPDTQKGKPKAGGTVYVYGTSSPKEDEKIINVLKWTADGKGGDGRGKMLVAQNYDDGRCHQLNANAISQQRQKEFPDPVPGQPGSNHEQWCETDVKMPADVTGSLTLYWIWQWPTAAGVDQIYPQGKDEYYTTCADVKLDDTQITADDIVDKGLPLMYTLPQQDPQSMAPRGFETRVALTVNPVMNFAVPSTATPRAATTAASSAISTSSHGSKELLTAIASSRVKQFNIATVTVTKTVSVTTAVTSTVVSTTTQMQTVTVTDIRTPPRRTSGKSLPSPTVSAADYPGPSPSFTASTSFSSSFHLDPITGNTMSASTSSNTQSSTGPAASVTKPPCTAGKPEQSSTAKSSNTATSSAASDDDVDLPANGTFDPVSATASATPTKRASPVVASAAAAAHDTLPPPDQPSETTPLSYTTPIATARVETPYLVKASTTPASTPTPFLQMASVTRGLPLIQPHSSSSASEEMVFTRSIRLPHIPKFSSDGGYSAAHIQTIVAAITTTAYVTIASPIPAMTTTAAETSEAITTAQVLSSTTTSTSASSTTTSSTTVSLPATTSAPPTNGTWHRYDSAAGLRGPKFRRRHAGGIGALALMD